MSCKRRAHSTPQGCIYVTSSHHPHAGRMLLLLGLLLLFFLLSFRGPKAGWVFPCRTGRDRGSKGRLEHLLWYAVPFHVRRQWMPIPKANNCRWLVTGGINIEIHL